MINPLSLHIRLTHVKIAQYAIFQLNKIYTNNNNNTQIIIIHNNNHNIQIIHQKTSVSEWVNHFKNVKKKQF